jgi:hypothetical protein
MNNLSGRSQRIKQLDEKLYKKFLEGILTLEQCEQLLKIKQKSK